MANKKTSVSDYVDYKKACLEAATHKEAFDVFKKNPKYTPILEHVTYEQGLYYLNTILDYNNLDWSKIEKMKENDIYGSADKREFPEPFNNLSPSTLRYIKVLTDLIDMFGSLDSMKIVEIGVGYGGQSKIIMDYFNNVEYYYVDLPEVLALTKTYLEKFDYEKVNFLDFEELPDMDYDLVISNFALTECSTEIQDLYFKKIINKCKLGYVTTNSISAGFGIKSYKIKDELLGKFKNPKIIPDFPIKAPGNFIISFDNRKNE